MGNIGQYVEQKLPMYLDSMKDGTNPDLNGEKGMDARLQEIISSTQNIQDVLSLAMKQKESGRDTPAHMDKTQKLMDVMTRAAKMVYPDSPELADAGMLVEAASLHDLGKLCIPKESILDFAGRFSDAQRAVINTHPEYGARIINALLEKTPDDKMLQYAHQMASQHHERYDGNGYPNKIGGDDISLAARMMAVVDVMEALSAVRVYNNEQTQRPFETVVFMMIDSALSPEGIEKLSISSAETIEQLKWKPRDGAQFDPKLVKAFLSPEFANEVKNILYGEDLSKDEQELINAVSEAFGGVGHKQGLDTQEIDDECR